MCSSSQSLIAQSNSFYSKPPGSSPKMMMAELCAVKK